MNNEDGIIPKRNRGANYTSDEKILLLQIIKEYKEVIENKKTDHKNAKDKEIAWQKICNQFNVRFPNKIYRPLESLRKYYENIKKKIRKDVADDKVKRFATGGGMYKPIIDPTTELAMTIINEKTIYGMNNSFDNDFESDVNQENNESNSEIMYYSMDIILDENNDLCSNKKGSHNENLNSINKKFNDDDENQPQISNVQWESGNAASSLKKSVSKKLIQKIPRTSWASRRRPTTAAALSSSQLSKKYCDLSDAKMELANLQKQALILDIQLKEKELIQMEEDHKLKMKLYEIQIEKARKCEDS